MNLRISKTMIISLVVLLGVLIGVPLGLITYEAHRTGEPFGEYVSRILSKTGKKSATSVATSSQTLAFGPRIDFLKKIPVGDPIGETKPWITNLAIFDLDQDGLKDVVVCDAKLNQVCWIKQGPAETYTETRIGSQVRAPAHVTPCDIDGDGDLDLLIASMGMIFPNNDKIGSVVALENIGGGQFKNRVLAENVARVTDVEPGDFNRDGLIDLAVGQFGYDDGEIRWMENKGNWQFESHILMRISGAINTLVADMDGDGDLDIVVLVSQEWEEIYVFENDGRGKFKPRKIYGSTNEDFGSSGISLVDLDKDGDLDILYTNGDAFDYIPPGPRPWHGVQWLENKGSLKFEYHRIGDFPGAYSARAADVDHDGDLDIVVVSCFNRWDDPKAQSMIWFENDGRMAFTHHDITSTPSHLLILESADMDSDGWVDFVTGGMYTYPPYDRMSRVTLWKNIWPERKIVQ
jgi:hypothetical protein